MKSECHQKKVIVASESRKIRKPLMEKKRRARINDSLETLKQMLLDSKTILKESSGKQGQRTAKLEKADILEMTVNYLQYLHRRLNETAKERIIASPSKSKPEIAIRPADSSCEAVTLIPTKLNTGEIVFVVPSVENNKKYSLSNCSKIRENMWRPW